MRNVPGGPLAQEIETSLSIVEIGLAVEVFMQVSMVLYHGCSLSTILIHDVLIIVVTMSLLPHSLTVVTVYSR